MTAADAPPQSVHRHAIAALVLATVICAMIAAQSAWPIVLERALTEGSLAIAWAAAMAGIGSLVLPGRVLQCDASPALRWATWSAVGIGVVSVIVLGLGLAGWLNRVLAWGILSVGWIVLMARVFVSWRHSSGGESAPWLSTRFELTKWIWLTVCAAPGLAVLIVAPCVLPGVLWGDEPHGYDVVSYHLQIPREWYESGRISPLAHNVFSFFPQGMEMQFVLAMHLRGGPWAGMYLAQYQHGVVAMLAAVAMYGGMRDQGRGAAVVGFVLTLATPWVLMVGTVGYNEALLVLYAALAMIWLIRAIQDGAVCSGVIAGVFGGLACGVKLTSVAMVVGCAGIAILLVARPIRRGVALAAVFLTTAVICSSPWWGRNLAWAGNPVFPEATGIFSAHTFSPEQVERWRAAHQSAGRESGAAARLRAAAERVPLDWRYGYALFPAAIISLLWGWRDRKSRFLGAFLLLQAIVWVSLTHVQGRFLLTALPALVMLVAMLAEKGRAPATLAAVVCLVGAGCTCVLIGRLATTHPVSYVPETAADLWNLRPEDQVARLQDGNRPIALAGDAKAFWWPAPMSRLHYRTVFDVDVAPGESLIDAWIRGAPANAIVIVDPGELRRFVQTYRGLGSLPREIEGREEPFVLR